jgi:hypothetical protein
MKYALHFFVDIVMLDNKPIIDSTYSCIQASTMRKKTGATLGMTARVVSVNIVTE